MAKEKISIVVPCYNEEEALPLFYKEICKVAKEMKFVDFEFLFINDGSKDRTLEILKEYAKKDKRVRFISFSRNFGKEAGMYAKEEVVEEKPMKRTRKGSGNTTTSKRTRKGCSCKLPVAICEKE